MPPLEPEVDDTIDLRSKLIEFWLGVIDSDAEYPERMKASELLAKYILDLGKTPVKGRKTSNRPPTADVLKFAEALEKKRHAE